MALWPVIHERIHHHQQLEMLLLFFYLWYGAEFLVRYLKYRNRNKVYINISFEREAYTHEYDSSYLDNRRFWNFINYL